MAGPAVIRIGAPISAAMIIASVVLPRPGGPDSSTWSAGAPRRLGGLEHQLELLADLRLADELARVASGRSAASTASFLDVVRRPA